VKRLPLFRSLATAALVLAAALVLWAATGGQTQGAISFGILYLVDSTGDGDLVGPSTSCDDGTGHCTLRAAIEASNLHGGTDFISFNIPTTDPGFSNGVWTINLTKALPDISDSVSINGPDATKLSVQRNAITNFRIFNVTATGTVSFTGMSIFNGVAAQNGGGIQNASSGALNITGCTIGFNQAVNGGGIANSSSGQITITNCSIENNTAQLANGPSAGGGIFNQSGTVTIVRSLLDANLAQALTSGWNSYGGGIYNNGTVTLVNCTLFDNGAMAQSGSLGNGGGIYNAAGAVITNSTVGANFVSSPQVGVNAGGIQNAGTAQVKSSVIAKNAGPNRGSSSVVTDVVGSFASFGFNLVGVGDGSAGFTTATDQTGTAAAPLDPKFQQFNGLLFTSENGGPTRTLALQSGSPAIDKGTSNGLTGTLTTDQRGVGYKRTIDKSGIANAGGGDGTDIGAYEVGAHISAVSRKMHGSVGTFGVQLPLFGPQVGIECRSGGTSGVFKMILTFPKAVTVDAASVVPDPKKAGATASVSSFTVSGSRVTVNLTGVSNAQTIRINLANVSDGTNTNDVSVPMGVLLGDTNSDRSVTDADVTLTQSKVGQAVTKSTFREDVTLDGAIDNTDVSLVQSNVGTKLP